VHRIQRVPVFAVGHANPRANVGSAGRGLDVLGMLGNGAAGLLERLADLLERTACLLPGVAEAVRGRTGPDAVAARRAAVRIRDDSVQLPGVAGIALRHLVHLFDVAPTKIVTHGCPPPWPSVAV